MKIYTFSAELESAVIELLEDTRFLLPQLSNSDTPAYVKALRHLKATRPSVFQIRSTGAQIDHPGKSDVGDTVHADSEHEQDDSDLSQLRGQLGVGHVLPDGFQRIRYYGFLGNRYREQKLAHCRRRVR